MRDSPSPVAPSITSAALGELAKESSFGLAGLPGRIRESKSSMFISIRDGLHHGLQPLSQGKFIVGEIRVDPPVFHLGKDAAHQGSFRNAGGHDVTPAERKARPLPGVRSEEHTSELQSHSFISYAVFCLKK